MNKRRLIIHERQSVKYFYLSISNAGGQTYVASFLLAILDVRSSKVVEAAAMVVAFIIPRVKSTVALRAVGHLAMWLLWRTSGFLASEASDLNLERRGQLSVSSSFDAIPRRAATSGGGIRNSPVFTVVMNGFLRNPSPFLAPLRSSSLSLSCSSSFFNLAFRTSVKSSVDSVMLGLIAGTERQLSWLLLRDSLLNGFGCSLDRAKWSFDLLIRLRWSNVGSLLAFLSGSDFRLVSSSLSSTRGRFVSNPSFWRIVNAAFPLSRPNGSPLAVGANAEIPAGMILSRFRIYHFPISPISLRAFPLLRKWKRERYCQQGYRASEFTDWTMSLESTDICRRRATHIFLLGGHSITLTTVNFAHA